MQLSTEPTDISQAHRPAAAESSGQLPKSHLPPYLIGIIALFLGSRVILAVIGVFSRIILGRTTGFRLEWEHPQALWLDIWGQWDSGWYLDIAQSWYSSTPRMDKLLNINFFPLYPTLMKGAGMILGNNFFAGFIISNLCLLGAAIFLYRLVLLDNDEATAMRSVKYLFVWPTSFVLSSLLSEGLFLFLLIIMFYLARRERWYYAGICGFFLCLTRSNGIVMLLPLLYAYLHSCTFKPGKIRLDIIALALLPAGLAIFLLYTYQLTGDPLAFVHSQAAFGRHFANPVTTLYSAFAESLDDFSAWFALAMLAFLFAGFKKLPWDYWLLCLLTLGITLGTGLLSMPRLSIVIFPFFILLAHYGKKPLVDQTATVLLALLQGFLMVFWSTGSYLII